MEGNFFESSFEPNSATSEVKRLINKQADRPAGISYSEQSGKSMEERFVNAMEENYQKQVNLTEDFPLPGIGLIDIFIHPYTYKLTEINFVASIKKFEEKDLGYIIAEKADLIGEKMKELGLKGEVLRDSKDQQIEVSATDLISLSIGYLNEEEEIKHEMVNSEGNPYRNDPVILRISIQTENEEKIFSTLSEFRRVLRLTLQAMYLALEKEVPDFLKD